MFLVIGLLIMVLHLKVPVLSCLPVQFLDDNFRLDNVSPLPSPPSGEKHIVFGSVIVVICVVNATTFEPWEFYLQT